MPVGIKKIDEAAFYHCISLEIINIPSTVEKIEDATFYGCKKLEKLVIPNGVKELGVCSFYGCTELKELVIPDSMKIIEDAVFMGCDALTQVVIPESVTAKATFGTEKITYHWYEGGKAISGATGASYKISKGKKVGSYTYTCKVTSSGYSQVTKAAIVTVKAPAKGKKYKDDKKMATYKVTSIAKNAFKNNKNIKRLTIEKNVEKIGANAFCGCKKLKTITIKTTKLKAKKIGAAAFKNTHANVTVKVPKKKLKAYKTMLLKKGVSKKSKISKI